MVSNAIDGLEVDASALKATMDTDVTSLVSDLKSMIPELPALPDVNLQGQLTSLAGLAVGSGAHNTLLASVTSKFGSGLTAGGFSLDSLVSDAASAISGGTDLCSAVPNFTIPAAGGDAVQKAVEVLQAEEDSLPEEPSTLLANANFTAAKTAVESKVAKMQSEGESTDVDVVKGTITSKTPPTEDVAAFTVAEESKEVTFGGDGKTTKVKVTTPIQQAGKNVAPSDSGFTKRRRFTQERIKLKDVSMYTLTFAADPTTGIQHEERVLGFDLSRTPISIAGEWGYTYDVPLGEFEPDAPL